MERVCAKLHDEKKHVSICVLMQCYPQKRPGVQKNKNEQQNCCCKQMRRTNSQNILRSYCKCDSHFVVPLCTYASIRRSNQKFEEKNKHFLFFFRNPWLE